MAPENRATVVVCIVFNVFQSENRSTADCYKIWTGADNTSCLRKVAEWNNQRFVLCEHTVS